MAEDTTAAPEKPVVAVEPPTPAKKRTPAEQDQTIANDIAAARTLIDGALKDEQAAALLAPRGYDAAALGHGDALQMAAQDAYTRRQTALAAQTAADAAAQAARTNAETAYMDFRETVRARFPDRNDQTALGVTGAVPGDREMFLTRARASFAAAAQPPYAERMAASGYDAEGLAAANTQLDAFAAALAAQNAAAGEARGATEARNDAVRALREWVRAFQRISRVALRTRPDLLRKLGQ